MNEAERKRLVDWEWVVCEARYVNPFTVTSLVSSMFDDHAELSQQYTHRKKDADKNPALGQGQDVSEELKQHPNGLWRMTRQTLDQIEPKLPLSLGIHFPVKYPNIQLSLQNLMTSSI